MDSVKWREHRLDVGDHEMAWYESGGGALVLFLNGCYDSLLYRPLADLFSHKYRCVLYDQRGSGNSVLRHLDEESLHIDRLVADIESFRTHLGPARVSIIGHSWGATLGLLYAGRFPHRVERLALIGLGPFSDEMHAVYKANVLRSMHAADRSRWQEVNGAYQAAWRSGKGVPRVLDEANIRIWSPVMFYRLDHAEAFAAEYLRAGGYRRHAPFPAGHVRGEELERAARITADVLVMYGYQDYEPITQAYVLKEHMPHARISFLNECGHMVWADQPGLSFRALDAFLSATGCSLSESVR